MSKKEYLRAMAESERLMDDGLIPWVWAKNLHDEYERLAVAPQIMEELGLTPGQTINSILLDAIADRSLEILGAKLDDMRQRLEDQLLTDDFDFRTMLGEDNAGND